MGELLATDRALMKCNKVVTTPNTAFHTREAVQRIAETTLENIVGCVEREPRHLVVRPTTIARR